mmetsp:Transcript_141269/g.246328  ORF Transcript_141269/g.246328 Transcript_141269/m.246328 type:complete len:242 (+) Transcript_141269:637-1362(+)
MHPHSAPFMSATFVSQCFSVFSAVHCQVKSHWFWWTPVTLWKSWPDRGTAGQGRPNPGAGGCLGRCAGGPTLAEPCEGQRDHVSCNPNCTGHETRVKTGQEMGLGQEENCSLGGLGSRETQGTCDIQIPRATHPWDKMLLVVVLYVEGCRASDPSQMPCSPQLTSSESQYAPSDCQLTSTDTQLTPNWLFLSVRVIMGCATFAVTRFQAPSFNPIGAMYVWPSTLKKARQLAGIAKRQRCP